MDRLSKGQLKLRDRSVNRLSAAAFDPGCVSSRPMLWILLLNRGS
jgi:hypothetical protein